MENNLLPLTILFSTLPAVCILHFIMLLLPTYSLVSSIVISPTWSIPAAAGQKKPVPEE